MNPRLDDAIAALRSRETPRCPPGVSPIALARARAERLAAAGAPADPLAALSLLVPRSAFALPAVAAAMALGAFAALLLTPPGARAPDRRELAARTLGFDTLHTAHVTPLYRPHRHQP